MMDGMEDEKFQPGWAGIEAGVQEQPACRKVSPRLSKHEHQLQFLAPLWAATGPPACAGVDGKGPALSLSLVLLRNTRLFKACNGNYL